MTATTRRPQPPRLHRAPATAAAVVSIVTMPLTAMWFLLAGGGLLVAALLRVAQSGRPSLGTGGSVGLGLLAGPMIYVGLAVVQ